MPDVLEKRYECYFRHPDDDHDVLDVGDQATACSNLQRALGMLDIETPSVDSTAAGALCYRREGLGKL